MYIKNVEDLRIHQFSSILCEEIFRLINRIPQYWQIPESNQIKRSSSSVSANIAEGFSSRFYTKKFIYYLSIAMASSDECQNHLHILHKKNYIDKELYERYSKQYKSLSIKILNFINYLRAKHKIKT